MAGGLFGGMASGLQSGIQLGQRQQLLKNQQVEQFVKRATGQLKQTQDLIGEMLSEKNIRALKDGNFSNEEIYKMVELPMIQAQRFNEKLGQPSLYNPQLVQTKIASVLNSADARALELKRKAEDISAERGAGREEDVIDIMFGTKRDPNAPPPTAANQPGAIVDIKTGQPTGALGYWNPDTRRNEVQGTGQPIPPGTMVQKIDVVGASTQSALGISESDVEQASLDRFNTQQSITEIGQLFRQVDEAGAGVTGLRGVTIDTLGGLVGQISPEFESAIAQGLGGVTPEQVREFRTRARAQIAKLVPVFTGEEGSRISDKELQISELATGLLSPTASITQIRASLPLIMELKISDQMKQDIIAGRGLTYDLSTPEGLNALGNKLMGYGMTQNVVTGMLRDLSEIQKDLQALQ